MQVENKKVIALLAVACTLSGFGIGYIMPKRDIRGTEGLEKIEAVYSILKDRWYYADQVDNIDDLLTEQALMGMTTLEKDPHTNYFDLEQAKQFQQSLAGSQVGAGFTYFVQEDGNMVIQDVFINSAAEEAGVRKGDIITVVGNKICSQTKTEDIISYIQDHDGKEITLHVLRGEELKQLKVTPREFDSSVVCNVHDGYGEIILSSFAQRSGEDFADAVQRLKDNGINKLLLDLRGNTGGYLFSAIDIASSLLPKKSVVFKEYESDGKIVVNKVNKEYDPVSFDQIVILQNQRTASASEVLIGALKDNLKDDVVTVGTTSYGKGTEQVNLPFDDGTHLKYTTAEWKTPKDTSINNKGFAPDVEVKNLPVYSAQYVPMEKDEIIEPDSVHINAQAAQLFLQYLGYNVDRTDTYFSYKSSEELKQFQKENGLKVTGVIDQTTWNRLETIVQSKINQNKSEEDKQRNRAIELF